MLTTTDIIITLLMFLFLSRGWRLGFFRMLIGPFCFIFYSIIAVAHFDLTRNIAKSLLITVCGTVVSMVIINLILLFGRSQVDKKHRNYIFPGSRLAGALLSAFWKGIIVLTILLLLSILPLGKFGYGMIQKDISSSYTHYWVNENIVREIPAAKNAITTFQLLSDPAYAGHLAGTPEYMAFFANEKIKKIKNDKELANQIGKKNLLRVISNPLVVDVINDDQLMQKLSHLSKKLYEERVKLYKEEAASGKKMPAPADRKKIHSEIDARISE